MKYKWIEALPIEDKKKSLLLSISFYLIMIPIGLILNVVFPSDMCNPGLGALFFVLIIPMSVVGLVVRNFILLGQGKKENVYSFWFHLSIIIIGVICLKLR